MTFVLPSFGSSVISAAPASGGGGGSAWNNNTYAISFDGTNDYMTMGTNTLFDTGSAFSYSGWVKLDSYSNVYQTIAQFKTNHSNGFQLLLSNQSSYQGLNIGSNDNTNMMKVKTDGDISSTFLNWTHVAFTYNGSGGSASANYKIFINGSEIATVATGPYVTLSNFNSVGAGNNGSTFYVNGVIDEVAIFNSELSASDITNIYNSGLPNDISSLNPVGWWRMGDNDGGTGTTITDQGSGGNGGTLTNGPTFSTNVPLAPLVLPSITNTSSVEFDGTNDYMDFGTNTTINSTSAFSVSAWFDVDNISTTYPTICLLKTNLTKGFVISLSNTTGGNSIYNGVWFGSANNEFRGYATNNSTLSASLVSGFHHVILTYDGVDPLSSSSFTIYVDGVNYSIRSTSVQLGSYANVNYVAKGAYQFDGLIDEFAIFNTELTQREVTGIYNSGTPNDISSLNPVGWWRMGDNDGGTGTTITDQGSGGNDGTLTNGPTFSTTVP